MPTINLRKYYPFLTEDRFVEVSGDVAEAFLLAKRKEDNYNHRTWYHKAYYRSRAGTGAGAIENAVQVSLYGVASFSKQVCMGAGSG